MLTADDVKALLGLRRHELEGGWFVETYRAAESTAPAATPPGHVSPRPLSTAIYYLLTPDTCSRIHRLASDEVFHFYLGDPVEMLQLGPGLAGRVLTLGSDLASGMRPQCVVPRGVWQGSHLVAGGRYALLGTTVAPGFTDADYETGRRDDLVAAWPAFRDLIAALTPEVPAR